MSLFLIRTASRLHLLLVVFLVLALSACGEKQTPEEQVRLFIAAGKVAVESRDVIALSELISDQYGDTSGRDRRKLVGLITGYFLRNKNINLFSQINDIQFSAQDSARVRLYVGMAGTPVSGAQALIDLRADLIEFDLTLIKESDDWKLLKADWQHASLDDLLGGEK